MNNAFTLIELIIVVVMLAILATIAFLSYSSQSASARDSTRLSDMTNISKWLWIFNAMAWKYPKPDDSISITASWIHIWFQWYAWANVLKIIKLSEGWKDPLDKITYYTYSSNKSQSKFQLLWFLEDRSNLALSFAPWIWNPTNADSSSFSWRYAIVRWDELGIILSSSSSIPVQMPWVLSWTTIDVATTNTEYKVHFNNTDSITWSWSKLIILKGLEDASYKYDTSLVWYWDMETIISDWYLADISWNWNHWTLSWNISMSNKMLNMNTNWNITTSYKQNLTKKTIISKISSSVLGSQTIVNQWWWGWAWNASYWFRLYLSGWVNKLLFETYNTSSWSSFIVADKALDLNKIYHVWVVYDENSNPNSKLYIDWVMVKSWNVNNNQVTNLNLAIWREASWNKQFLWNIGATRLYKRALSDTEITNLYNASK